MDSNDWSVRGGRGNGRGRGLRQEYDSREQGRGRGLRQEYDSREQGRGRGQGRGQGRGRGEKSLPGGGSPYRNGKSNNNDGVTVTIKFYKEQNKSKNMAYQKNNKDAEKNIKDYIEKINLYDTKEAIRICKELCTSDDTIMSVTIALVKLIKTPEQVMILDEMDKTRHLRKSAKLCESPFNYLIWRRDDISNELFQAIADALHKKGFTIEHESDRGEAPLDSLFAWFATKSFNFFLKENNSSIKTSKEGGNPKELEKILVEGHRKRMLYHEPFNFVVCKPYLSSNCTDLLLTSYIPGSEIFKLYEFRYMIIANITPDQVIRKVNGIINRVSTKTDKQIWNLRQALCRDYKSTIDTLASYMVSKKPPTSCSDIDRSIQNYLDFIITSFSGADNGFVKMPISEKMLELFFKLNQNKLPSADDLLSLFVQRCKHCAFTSTTENQTFDLEGLGILLGSFAGGNYALEEYNGFILDCLATQYIKPDFAKIDQEIRLKMAIRAVVHGNKVSDDIERAFDNYPIPNGFFRVAVDKLLGKRKMKIKVQVEVSVIIKFNIDKLTFFEGLLKEPDFAITTSLEKLQNVLEEQKDITEKDIILRFLNCLLENANPKTDIEYIMEKVREIVKTYYIQSALDHIKTEGILEDIDAPYAQKSFERIKSCIESS